MTQPDTIRMLESTISQYQSELANIKREMSDLRQRLKQDKTANKSIGMCEWCGMDYCLECTSHDAWRSFCTEQCRDASDFYRTQELFTNSSRCIEID